MANVYFVTRKELREFAKNNAGLGKMVDNGNVAIGKRWEFVYHNEKLTVELDRKERNVEYMVKANSKTNYFLDASEKQVKVLIRKNRRIKKLK